MRTVLLQTLSVLLLILAVVWFIFEPGFEPVITAIAGLAGLFSAEFIKPVPEASPDEKEADPPRVPGEGGAERKAGEGSEGAAEAEFKTIVVLPFENLSPDPDNAFFADGLTEEIITDLSRVGAIKVISRTSALSFRGISKTVPAIAEELGVRFALEGSVRREADSLRITAQLIDAVSDTHLWAEKYSGTMVDVFDLQERLSRSIVEALKVTLSPEEDRRLAARPITDARAHDIWLQARQHALTLTADGVLRAKELVEQALSLQPDNALLHATLAWVHAVRWGQLEVEAAEELVLARENATKAMELDPELPWSLFSMAIVSHREADLQGFVHLGKKVLEFERDSHTLAILSLYLAHAGIIEPARAFGLEAASLDPLSWLTTAAGPHAELFAGKAEIAFGQMRELATRLAPGEAWPAFNVGYSALQAGRRDDAHAWFEKTIDCGPTFYAHLSRLFLTVLQQDPEGASQVLETTPVAPVAERVGISSYWVASCLIGLGWIEEGLEWLERGVEKWFTNHRFMGEHDRLLTGLRGTPRFESILRRAREMQDGLEI
jgi:TolB-like protein/Tfp pilus assembly protein PilF